MSLKKMVVGLCCVALLTAAAQAAPKLKITNLPVPFPGVDTSGFLDPGNPGLGMAKVTVNLRTFAVTVSGRGNVPNLAFVRVVFVDQDALGIGGGLILLQDKYTVSARGAASYSGKFQVP